MERVPDETESLFDAALDYMARGEPEVAARQFEHIVTLNPGHAEARHGLIRALEDAGRTDEALAAVLKLIASDPDDVLAQTRLSMIYQHQGKIPEAEAAAAKAKILGWKQELRSGISVKTDL